MAVAKERGKEAKEEVGGRGISHTLIMAMSLIITIRVAVVEDYD